MKPFYSTPGIVNPLPVRTERTGQELVDWLEDRFADYRRDAANGYFQPKPEETMEFERKIAEAKADLAAVRQSK